MTKCASCKDLYPRKNLLILCEAELGFGSMEDYIVCHNCYNKIERELEDECSGLI